MKCIRPSNTYEICYNMIVHKVHAYLNIQNGGSEACSGGLGESNAS